jgi:conjugative relaxase-like TrwC/TraI family protein
MVGVTKIQRQNANYWIEAVAGGEEDYYTKPGESPGRWLGSAAARLGLQGEIGSDEYAAALAGRDPRDGSELVHRPPPRSWTDGLGRERHAEPVLGFDVRFAAPKSVSLLYALGSPQVRDAALRAHDAAVAEAIAYLERHACLVQRGRGGANIEPGRGFVAMGFRHRSSRAGDPALHTHVLVANMTRAASDDRWLSLASPRRRTPLFTHAKPAGYLYQASLRAHLTRELGLEWTPSRNGYADIAAIGRPAIEHFSRRRAEIEEALAAGGSNSAKAAEVAAYRTRAAKDYGVDPDSRREDWLSRAAEFDLGPRQLDSLLDAARPREPGRIGEPRLATAIASLEAERSHFDRRDLLCAIAGQLREGAGGGELDRAVDALLGSRQVIEIGTGTGLPGEQRFTTPRLLALERRFLEIAEETAALDPVSAATVSAALQAHPHLGADQVEVVRRLAEGAERVAALGARPGTGKTTALAAARAAWELDGRPVIGVAAARSAAGELADAGIPASSITALLIRAEEWKGKGVSALDRGTVIVCDEASTASTPQLAALGELVQSCEGRLICVGDPRQIGSIGAGGLFAHLTRIREPAELTEIRRQVRGEDRRIVELAHEGRGSDAIDLLRAGDRLRITDTLPQALDALALDWHARFAVGEDAVMIARRARDVSALNQRARRLLATEHEPDAPRLPLGDQEIAVGATVITRVNSSQVSNRERWRVIGADPTRLSLDLERIGGDQRRVRLDRSYLESQTPRGEPAIQHGFALTAYAAEAKTFDSALVLLDPGAGREEFLVQVSRARGETVAYGVASNEFTDPELGPARHRLEDEAHELRAAAERVSSDFVSVEFEERERVARMGLPDLARRRRELRAQITSGTRTAAERRAREFLDKRIASFEAMLKQPPTADPTSAATDLTERQLALLRHERDELDRGVAAAPRFDADSRRLRLSLIEERGEQLTRRLVAAERLEPSALTLAALGERPTDPVSRERWNQAAHSLHTYRVRNGLSHFSEAQPLGPPPSDPGQNAEWRSARRELDDARSALGLGRSKGLGRELL